MHAGPKWWQLLSAVLHSRTMLSPCGSDSTQKNPTVKVCSTHLVVILVSRLAQCKCAGWHNGSILGPYGEDFSEWIGIVEACRALIVGISVNRLTQ